MAAVGLTGHSKSDDPSPSMMAHSIGVVGAGGINLVMNYHSKEPDQRVTNDLKTIIDHSRERVNRADFRGYDFRSIIDSKLSDINLHSFGREWLFGRAHD